jgi:hypothetical protein
VAKINDKQLKTIPISFSKIQEFESNQTDSRFTEVLIKILHLGRNYNGSVFKKSVVEDAIPTLANTPILGFIEPNKQGVDDFSDHRIELVKENGEQKFRYMGHAYGVISETQAKNAYFQEDLCSDGIVREYLYVKGLLFNKFDYVIDMFKSNDGSYNQSMELSSDYSGSFDSNEGGFVFDKFAFDGACIITCDPAMIDSEITTNFSKENTKSIAEEIENKLNEFAKYFSKKEDDKMAKKEKLEQVNIEVETPVVENFEKAEKQEEKVDENFDSNNQDDDSEVDQSIADAIEEVAEAVDNVEDTIDGGADEEEESDDFEKKEKEDMPMDESPMKDDKDMEDMACKDKEHMEKDESKKKFSLNFELSHEDISCQLYDKLFDMGMLENTCYCIVKTMDNYFVYCDCMTCQFFEQAYTNTDDTIVFTGERKEIFNILVDKETKDAMSAVTYSKLQKDLEEANKKIEEYSKANEELLKFQLDIKENERKEEINKVISNFSKINELDLEKYRQKAYNKEISKEQLEDKLYAELGKMNFSKITGEEVEEKIEAPVNYTVSLDAKEQDKCPYAGCEALFSSKK